jgi:hypothetical protein
MYDFVYACVPIFLHAYICMYVFIHAFIYFLALSIEKAEKQ